MIDNTAGDLNFTEEILKSIEAFKKSGTPQNGERYFVFTEKNQVYPIPESFVARYVRDPKNLVDFTIRKMFDTYISCQEARNRALFPKISIGFEEEGGPDD